MALKWDEFGDLENPEVFPPYFLVHVPERRLQAYSHEEAAHNHADEVMEREDLGSDDVYVAEAVLDDDGKLFYSATHGYPIVHEPLSRQSHRGTDPVGLEDYPYIAIDPSQDYIMFSWDDARPIELGDLTELHKRGGTDLFLVRRVADDPVRYEAVAASATVRDVADALARVNAHRRAQGLRPLDPVAAGWTDDDVIKEAERVARFPNVAGLLLPP